MPLVRVSNGGTDFPTFSTLVWDSGAKGNVSVTCTLTQDVDYGLLLAGTSRDQSVSMPSITKTSSTGTLTKIAQITYGKTNGYGCSALYLLKNFKSGDNISFGTPTAVGCRYIIYK